MYTLSTIGDIRIINEQRNTILKNILVLSGYYTYVYLRIPKYPSIPEVHI